MANVQPLDFRYPGVFNLNQTPKLPDKFGPPDMSSMLQSGISGLADPIVARMKEESLRSDSAKAAADALTALNKLYTSQQPTPAAPGAAPASTTSDAGTGTVPASALLQAGKVGIAGVESGGSQNPYVAQGPETSSGDRAYGKYQVMGNNIPAWTEKHLGVKMTPREFLASPEAQEKVFEGQFGSYLDRYGNLRDAASMWFSGRPMAAAGTASDGYSTVPQYIAKMEAHIRRQFGSSPVPPPAPTASFAPTVAPAPTPAAAAAVTAPAGYKPAYMDSATGRPIDPNDPRVNNEMLARPVPGRPSPQPQAPAAAGASPAPGQQSSQQQQSPQQQQEAQQQQILSTVGQATAQNAERLDGMREEAGRVRVASLDPGAGIPPRVVPTTRFGPDGQPIATPAPPAPAAAPAGTTAGPGGPPPQQPAVAPSPPIQVAQAQGLPPAVTGQQRGSYDPGVAAALLRNARTPEEVNRIAAALYQQLQPPAPSGERFQIIHDNNGNWVRIDRLTGQTTPMPGQQTKAEQTVELELGGNKYRMQWNPKTGRYDIPVGTPVSTNAPPSKEQFEQEYKLRDKFESDPETRRYYVANNAYQQMQSSAGSGNGVGDISLIYQYMKMLDPDTGVREGEYANAAQTGGIPDRIVNTYNRMVSGERLSDKQRGDFVNEAGRLLQVRHSNVVKAADRVRNNATAYQLSPDRVAKVDPYTFEPWSPPVDERTGRPRNDPGGTDAERAATAPGSPANPIPVPADREAAAKTLRALPTGKWFVMPDGTVSQKR